MIHVRCRIQSSNSISTKSFDFSDRHEETLVDYCGTIDDKIDARLRLGFDEFLTYCCYLIAQKIRAKNPSQSIEENLKVVFIKLADLVPLQTVRTVQFDATIDDKQTRQIIVENPDNLEYV